VFRESVKQKPDRFTSKISTFSSSHQGSITPTLVPPVCKVVAAELTSHKLAPFHSNPLFDNTVVFCGKEYT